MKGRGSTVSMMGSATDDGIRTDATAPATAPLVRDVVMAAPDKPGRSEPGRPGDQTVLEREPKLDKPKMFKVLLHNDDYTTMDFVVWVLREVFAMGGERALALMLAIHNQGRGVAGVYTRDIAETKAARVTELAEENGMPLLCTTEPDE
jgi:ATP-dependent Clp protease adaptor protein ClpS